MKKSIIVIADFINEIVHPKGAFGQHNAQRIVDQHTIEKANQLIAWGRNKGIAIAHVKVGFSQGYPECPPHSPMFGKAKEFGVLQLGTWGTEFHEEMDVQPQDYTVTKHRVSALYQTNLQPYLTAHGINHVIFAGISTNYVVETTVRELHDRDYQVTVVADACNAATQAGHDASITAMQRLAEIICVDELV